MEETITQKLDELKTLTLLGVKDMLTVDDVSLLTGFKKTYIRKMAEEGTLPYHKPFGRKLFFKKDEINKLLQGGRVPSVAELLKI